jgi:hypothetical protein
MKNKMMETGKYKKYSLPVNKGKRLKMTKHFLDDTDPFFYHLHYLPAQFITLNVLT